ncbi:ribosomal RNA small subunit methyltransferase A [Candidatus Wolfebacteria bacterium]|nr:ribosomal RNA small subunit methyltransferase A [Candidatus Wolfebacteria bacterium]
MRTYLGQNFLINKDKIKEIIDALELKANDVVIEIGPGHGELTENLKSQILNFKIIAIEKDKDLAAELKEKFIQDKNVSIIEGDALKILGEITNNLITNNYKLIGNIPYYITGHLLRIIGELENKPELIVLTIQKEVAERVMAEPPKNNILAASVQFWAKPEIIGYVSKTDFDPVPKVDSAIIRLKVITLPLLSQEKCYNCDKNSIKIKYYKFIKILFKQPRKTIINNLIYGFQNLTKAEIIEKLMKLKINPEVRPQDLNQETIIKLSQKF